MKKVFAVLTIIGLFLSPVAVSASTTMSCDTVWGNPDRMAENYQTIRQLAGHGNSGFITVGGLGNLLAGYAVYHCKEQWDMVPPAEQEPTAFLERVLRANGKQDLMFDSVTNHPDHRLTLIWGEDVLNKLIKPGIKLGLPSLESATQAVLPVATPVARTPVPAIPAEVTVLQRSLETVKAELEAGNTASAKQVQELQDAVTGLRGRLTSELGELSAKNTELFRALDQLEQSLTEDVQGSAEYTQGLVEAAQSRLQGEMAGLASQLAAVEAAVNELDGRVQQVEGQVGAVQYLWSAFKAIAVILFFTLLTLLLVLFLGWRWKSKDGVAIRALGERVAAVENTKVVFDNQLQEQKKSVARVETRVRDMEEGTYGIQFNPTQISRARLLETPEGEKVMLYVTDANNQKFLIEVTRGREEITVSGIERRKGSGQGTMTVPLNSHLPTLIAKAAKDGRLSNLQGQQSLEDAQAA